MTKDCAAQPRRVIVSLHDVAPPFEAAIRKQVEMLADVGVRRVVLKVVPNWHGAYPLQEAPALVDLLHAQVAAGGQLVLHGFEHRVAEPPSRSQEDGGANPASRSERDRPHGPFRGPLPRRMRARLFARDAAEFLTFSADAASAALENGLAGFAQVGLLAPTAFCAPGWLHNAETEVALRRTGFRYLVGMFTVRDLRDGHRIWTPGVGYMGASPSQEAGVQILNGMVRPTVFRRSSVAKVYLHPQRDPCGPLVRRLLKEIERMIRDEGWQPSTYTEVCGDE